MRIVILNKQQFDTFSNDHPLHTLYQTSMYGDLMELCGYSIFYYGFVDDEEKLIGATLLLVGKLFGNQKYAYAPRGFLLDYDNRNLVKDVSEKLKYYLKKNKFVFLKIDPPIINNKRDKDGNVIPSNYPTDLIPFFKQIGYSYFGENKYFGTLKPRWNAILKVTGSSQTLFNNFESSVKNKIRKAESRGVQIVQGSVNDIPVFYNFVAKKHYRNLQYYQNFAKSFGNSFEIYFAKLDSQMYLKNIKYIYEEELAKNEQLNEVIQTSSLNRKEVSDKITNEKINSDKLIAVYKSELVNASNLFERNPQGVIIGACAVVVEKHGIELVIEGLDPDYSLFYPTFLLKWFIIEKYAKAGAVYFDLNAITGDFANSNNKFKGLNEMKLGFNSEVTEYVGEFDLIIRKTLYNIYRNTKIIDRTMKKHN